MNKVKPDAEERKRHVETKPVQILDIFTHENQQGKFVRLEVLLKKGFKRVVIDMLKAITDGGVST